MPSYPDRAAWKRRAAMYRRGMTLAQIAEREGVTPASVLVMLRKAGVKMRPPGAPRRGSSVPYLATARRLRAKGYTLAEIGARVGRTGEAVRMALLRTTVVHGRTGPLRPLGSPLRE